MGEIILYIVKLFILIVRYGKESFRYVVFFIFFYVRCFRKLLWLYYNDSVNKKEDKKFRNLEVKF